MAENKIDQNVTLETHELTELKKMLFEIPLSDETKIQFLKEELNAGRYEIKSCSLADKLIEHAQVNHSCDVV